MTLTIFIDFDDTCVATRLLYDLAAEKCRARLHELGFDGTAALERHRLFDKQRIRELGLRAFRAARWADSMADVYHALCQETACPPDEAIRQELWSLAYTSMNTAPTAMEGVPETLAALQQDGHRLVLYSQADPLVQPKRVQQAGLARYFDTMCIVPHKSSEQLRNIMRTLHVKPTHCAAWGDSWKSDMLPALEASISLLFYAKSSTEKDYDQALASDARYAQAHWIEQPQAVIERIREHLQLYPIAKQERPVWA